MQTDLSVRTEINLYYDLHVPDGAGNAPLLIAVHGYGAHKRYMMREAKLVAPENFVIAAPQAPHQHFRKTDDGEYREGFGWYANFKTDEYIRLHHDFLLEIIDRLKKENLIDPARIYLYGFSQACALNFRFAFTYPELVRGIVAVCGGIPGDLDTNASYQPFAADTLYLYGDDDEFYAPEKFAGFDEKLRSLLPNFQSKQYNATHEISAEMREDIRKFFSGFPV